MEPRQITETYTVSGQVTPEEVGAIAAAGYAVLICNRPNNEQPGQPSAASVKAAAESAGLTFRYIPVVSGAITEEDVDAMEQALDEAEGPVFAYCRSGARCTNLFALVQQRKG